MKLDARAHRWSTWLVCVNAVLSTFFAELLNQSGLMSRALTCRCVRRSPKLTNDTRTHAVPSTVWSCA
jgi:hypothetical protein